MRKRLTDADKAKREAKRERRADREVAPPVAGPTLGQLIAREDLVRTAAKSTRRLIDDAAAYVGRGSRAVSCETCTAAKGCCKLRVTVLLHEVLPVADRLRRDGRDTPALRAELEAAAELMETLSQAEYAALRRPCAMLDNDERCTVYAERPRECGAAFVYSPAELCSDPAATTVEVARPPTDDVREQLGRTELNVEQAARLVRLQGPYMGVLPRMILLWLEAWDRSDYAAYLAERAPLAASRMAAAAKKP